MWSLGAQWAPDGRPTDARRAPGDRPSDRSSGARQASVWRLPGVRRASAGRPVTTYKNYSSDHKLDKSTKLEC